MYTIPKIKTIEQLKSYLHSGPGYDGYDVLFNSIDFDPEIYEHLCQWNDETYERIVLEKEDGCYELVLICWEKGQASPIHDHSSSESWIKVLQGRITERLFYKSNADGGAMNLKDTTDYVAGELCYVQDDFGFHQIANSYDGRSISLHLYAPPVESYKTYDESTGDEN